MPNCAGASRRIITGLSTHRVPRAPPDPPCEAQLAAPLIACTTLPSLAHHGNVDGFCLSIIPSLGRARIPPQHVRLPSLLLPLERGSGPGAAVQSYPADTAMQCHLSLSASVALLTAPYILRTPFLSTLQREAAMTVQHVRA